MNGKTLNTHYYEDLPSGWSKTNSIILSYSYYVFGTSYSLYDIIKDESLLIDVRINENSKIDYTPVGQYANREQLKIIVAKIS